MKIIRRETVSFPHPKCWSSKWESHDDARVEWVQLEGVEVDGRCCSMSLLVFSVLVNYHHDGWTELGDRVEDYREVTAIYSVVGEQTFKLRSLDFGKKVGGAIHEFLEQELG